MTTDRSISIHAENVQFRFLQLVHGGIECNCWKDIQLWIENNNDGMAQFHLDHNTNIDVCVNIGEINSMSVKSYCGGAVNETRGLITRIVDSGGITSGNINSVCPGDSDNLFSEYVTITSTSTTLTTTTEDTTTMTTTSEDTTTEDTTTEATATTEADTEDTTTEDTTTEETITEDTTTEDTTTEATTTTEADTEDTTTEDTTTEETITEDTTTEDTTTKLSTVESVILMNESRIQNKVY